MDDFKTPELMDIETENIAKRRHTLSKIALEIEEIFLREDLTMGELTEVMDLFNARAQRVFSNTKLKFIKETYDRQN